MQATETGQGAASGATVQRDPDGAVRVVVQCDRCPAEVERADEVSASLLTWTSVAVAVGLSPTKVLTLCPQCTRALRLFMLGATERNTATVGERWENLICGAV